MIKKHSNPYGYDEGFINDDEGEKKEYDMEDLYPNKISIYIMPQIGAERLMYILDCWTDFVINDLGEDLKDYFAIISRNDCGL